MFNVYSFFVSVLFALQLCASDITYRRAEITDCQAFLNLIDKASDEDARRIVILPHLFRKQAFL